MSRVVKFFGSKWFFLTTLLIFSIEVIWLIFADRYPMAFDEAHHYLQIIFFTHHLNPFIYNQSPSTYNIGAMSHNPSILYHYLLSFPLRLIEVFTKSLKAQIIILRLLNWTLSLISLVFARKILKLLNVPSATANLVIFIYAFTPIVSVLSAQINYDNLLLASVAISIYLAIKLLKQIASKNLSSIRLLSLLVLCLFSSEIKFTYLPIFLGIALAVVLYLIEYYFQDGHKLVKDLRVSFIREGRLKKTTLIVLLIIGLGVFVNFYGYNLIKYHNIAPQCQQVLTTKDCSQYYSWERNNTVLQYKKTHPNIHYMSVFSFTEFWFKVQYYQLFGEVIPIGGLVYIVKEFYAYIIFLSVVAALAAIYQIKTIFKKHSYMLPILIICLVYFLALWIRNYTNYLQLGKPLAIQGRYLLPVLIYCYTLAGLGLYYTLSKPVFKRVHANQILAGLSIIVFLYFGGFVRYASVITPKFGWNSVTTSKH